MKKSKDRKTRLTSTLGDLQWVKGEKPKEVRKTKTLLEKVKRKYDGR